MICYAVFQYSILFLKFICTDSKAISTETFALSNIARHFSFKITVDVVHLFKYLIQTEKKSKKF